MADLSLTSHMLEYSRGSETHGHVPGDLRQRAALLACSWTWEARRGSSRCQGWHPHLAVNAQHEQHGEEEDGPEGRDGQLGDGLRVCQERQAGACAGRGRREENTGLERLQLPQHTCRLSFSSSHVQSHLFRECCQPPFSDKETAWDGAGREAGGYWVGFGGKGTSEMR